MRGYHFGGGIGVGGGPLRSGERPTVTYALLAINGVVWLATMFAGFAQTDSGRLDVLRNFGAMYGPYVANGEYWRLFTAMFLHAGIWHLAGNSFVLFIFGQQVERIYGPTRFVLLYVLSGLSGSVASYLLNPLVTGVGASGAIFGVMGALAAFLLARRETLGEMGRQSLTGLLVIAVFNLIYGFTQPNVDNWAHIGGLAAGFLIGVALAPDYRLVDDRFGFGGRLADASSLARRLWVVPLALVILAGATVLGNSRTPNVETHFERAEGVLREGDRQASFNELAQALEIAARTGDSNAIQRALVRIDNLNR